MRNLVFIVFGLLIVTPHSIDAQSRRVNPAGGKPAANRTNSTTSETSVKQMFDEVSAYPRVKFTELETKKEPYSERKRLEIYREQKHLAAKFAMIAASRTDLTTDELYYSGLLNWIAENFDATVSSLQKYTDAADSLPQERQTARSILAIVAAKQRRFADATTALEQYKKNLPVKLSEQIRIESELAKAYSTEKSFADAVKHSASAFEVAKRIVAEDGVTQRSLDELLDTGMLLHEAHRDLGDIDKADAALIDLRKTAASINSTSMFAYAVDKLVVFQISSGRKSVGLETYLTSLIAATKELSPKARSDEAVRAIKKREKQYKLLGEIAPEFVDISAWFPGKSRTLQQLRGKVVLLDFWATWCGPCFDAFPSLSEWHRDFSADGLVILGLTRFYGQGGGMSLDNASEIEFLKGFKSKYDLPYDFVVAKNQITQTAYGATSLPTAVLIDRKGVIRYVESGTNSSRIEDLRAEMLRLLAEK